MTEPTVPPDADITPSLPPPEAAPQLPEPEETLDDYAIDLRGKVDASGKPLKTLTEDGPFTSELSKMSDVPATPEEERGLALADTFQKLNIPIEHLPPELKTQYDALVTGEGDSDVMVARMTSFMQNLKNPAVSRLSTEQVDAVKQLESSIVGGNEKVVIEALNRYIENPENNISEEERKEVTNQINRITTEMKDKDPDQMSKSPVIKEAKSKIGSILKAIGILLALLLGFGAFQGFMAGKQQQ